MTRIGAGEWKGRVLRTPDGTTTRPTGAKIRAALGNALQASGALEGARVLDLFAGSGALGLELLSRGAAALVAVENDRAAVEALRRNVSELVRPPRTVEVLAMDVAVVVPRLAAGRIDVVVADPPYALPDDELVRLLEALVPVLTPGADVIVERGVRSGEPSWPEPLEGVRAKRYGDTLLCYGRAP